MNDTTRFLIYHGGTLEVVRPRCVSWLATHRATMLACRRCQWAMVRRQVLGLVFWHCEHWRPWHAWTRYWLGLGGPCDLMRRTPTFRALCI